MDVIQSGSTSSLALAQEQAFVKFHQCFPALSNHVASLSISTLFPCVLHNKKTFVWCLSLFSLALPASSSSFSFSTLSTIDGGL